MKKSCGKRKSGLAVALLLVLFGCEFWASRYVSQEHKFSILLPSKWEKEEGFAGSVVLAKAVEEEPQYRTNISVSVGNLEEIQANMRRMISLEEYFEANKAQLLAVLPGAKLNVQEGEIVTTKNEKGRVLSFDYDAEDVKIRFLVAVWIKNSRAYTISCSSEVDRFSQYVTIFNKVIRSLKINAKN